MTYVITTTDLRWAKSSHSGGDNNCVETRTQADGMAVRDSKKGDAGPIQCFGVEAWTAFLDGVGRA